MSKPSHNAALFSGALIAGLHLIKLPLVQKKKIPTIPVVKIKPDFKVLSKVIENNEETINIDNYLDFDFCEYLINKNE